MKVWNFMLQGLQWSVKNGWKTNFCSGRWLDSSVLLRDYSINNQGVDFSLSVSNFVLPDGNWDVARLSNCLHNDALVQVHGMTPPCEHLGDDSIVWGLEASGKFNIKSAYLLVKDIAHDGQDTLWRKVWNWEGMTKIKQFMWLVSHGKLMTNEERRRRHISVDATCTECQAPCENIDHILRRNRLIFNNERLSVDEICGQVTFWTHLYSSSWKALQVSREAPSLARQAHLIGWRPAD
ncbi:Putative ribonuclease H protein At1g65750 [Linum perenne]